MGRASNLLGYLHTLSQISSCVVVTDGNGVEVDQDQAVNQIIELMHSIRENSNKIIFIGNGGSAAIASHMAIDYSKNGRLPAVSMNDGAALTCLGNDLGFENVFAEQLKLHGRNGDLLIAISSSGSSPNILRAVAEAQEKNIYVVTMTGFASNNPLRDLGFLNWYINSKEYGFVEISHLTLGHAILDIEMGWKQ